MTAARFKLVARMGSAESTLTTFFMLSFLLHVVFAIGALFMPDLRSRPTPMISTLPVSLVGAVPTSAPPKNTSSAATPEPDKVQALPEPPPKPSTKPAPKKQSKPDAPVKEPTRQQPVAAEDTAGSGEPADLEESGTPGLTAGLVGMGSEFYWYREAVNRSLYTSWRQPILQGLREPLEVDVYFEILQNGSIRGLRLESSSGISAVDRSVLRAVQEAMLPPLPRSFRKPTQEALITFQYFPDDH